MNTQVQCANCGLNNQPSQTNCLRCYASLAGLPISTAPSERRNGITLWIKLSAAAAVFFVLLLASSAIGVVWIARKSISSRNARFENAIRLSTKFTEPVIVEAGRYNYFDNDAGASQQEATPAAYTLAQMGLIYVHTGFYADASAGYVMRGKTILDPQQYRHVNLEVLDKAQSQSVNWEPYETKADGRLGWKVPIGERELLRVVDVVTGPYGTAPDTVMVSFAWNWKPNEMGQSFDKSSPSYIKPNTPKGYTRGPFDVEINDSRATYWGTADLHRNGQTWEVEKLQWYGTGGVRLSNRSSAEMERFLRETEDSR